MQCMQELQVLRFLRQAGRYLRRVQEKIGLEGSMPNDQVPSACSPVDRIETDRPDEKPSPGVGLCLSGGGYRAMLFHVGTIWRLNEAGLLPKLDRISSVSGGSITAGVLALGWPHLSFDGKGIASNLVDIFVILFGPSPNSQSTSRRSFGERCYLGQSATG